MFERDSHQPISPKISARVECISNLITLKLAAMVEVGDSDLIISKRKAINTLLPYAIYLEQGGQRGMMDTILGAARVSNFVASNTGKFIWRQVVLYISRLFEKQSPTSLNRVITLISPYVPWDGALNNPAAVARWAAAASAVPYTDDVGTSVVDALFQIAWVDFLRPHIPIDIWGWLKRQPPLPLMYHGLSFGGSDVIVIYVRRLGDIELLKSYFLILWTDRRAPSSVGTQAVEGSIREDFGGTGMEQHRKDLLERLDHVLGQLEQRLKDSPNDGPLHEAKKQYTKLNETLLEVDGR